MTESQEKAFADRDKYIMDALKCPTLPEETLQAIGKLAESNLLLHKKLDRIISLLEKS